MSETYNDRHDSKIYGARLIIYRRGDVENASFTFRAKIAGQKGYIRRNTKTDDPARAMVLAEQAYEELQVRKKSGLSLVQLSANAFFDEWVEKQKTKLTSSLLAPLFGLQGQSELSSKVGKLASMPATSTPMAQNWKLVWGHSAPLRHSLPPFVKRDTKRKLHMRSKTFQ